jgi:hypothetical protein
MHTVYGIHRMTNKIIKTKMNMYPELLEKYSLTSSSPIVGDDLELTKSFKILFIVLLLDGGSKL